MLEVVHLISFNKWGKDQTNSNILLLDQVVKLRSQNYWTQTHVKLCWCQNRRYLNMLKKY